MLELLREEKDNDAKKRKTDEHGASEPVWSLKRKAHIARRALQRGRTLQRKLERGVMKYERLSEEQQKLVENFNNRTLHVAVDKANVAYGHGVARTHDFGFEPGANMCRALPLEVRAHLALLKNKDMLDAMD